MDNDREQRWVKVLRHQCDHQPQGKIAEEISYSTAVVNQVLKGTYKGNLSRVESAVRGAYMGETVACPVLGELENHHCLAYQKRKYAATNPMRVKLFRACNTGCEHKRTNQERVNATSHL